VLLQRSEGGGLGIGGGGGGVMTGRGAATALSKVTWGLGIAFVATEPHPHVLAARDSATDSVLDRIRLDPGMAPVARGARAPPGLGDDLLPPIPLGAERAAPADGSPRCRRRSGLTAASRQVGCRGCASHSNVARALAGPLPLRV
jgi:preprotein translocase subunit SecG